MFVFLDNYYQKTLSDGLGILLSGLALLEDEKSMDPAFWHDWVRAFNNKSDANNLTAIQAFSGMTNFLEDYCTRGASDDIFELRDMLKKTLEKKLINSSIWKDWLQAINKIVQDKEEQYGMFKLVDSK